MVRRPSSNGTGRVVNSLKLDNAKLSYANSSEQMIDRVKPDMATTRENGISRRLSKASETRHDRSSHRHSCDSEFRQKALSSLVIPPPPPPLATEPNLGKNDTRSKTRRMSKDGENEKLQDAQHNKTSQEKALVSLLKEMRVMEQNMVKLSDEHAKERSALMDAMTQQGKYIDSLEQSISSEKAAFAKVLGQLSRFATGCAKFPSASVKKMSSALHHQVHEWGKVYDVDVKDIGTLATSEQTTMLKLQALHLEINELKKENASLKERVNNSSGRTEILSADHLDESSLVSGLTSTTKLIDAMSGFLNDYEHSKRVERNAVSVRQAPGASTHQDGGLCLAGSASTGDDRSFKPTARCSRNQRRPSSPSSLPKRTIMVNDPRTHLISKRRQSHNGNERSQSDVPQPRKRDGSLHDISADGIIWHHSSPVRSNEFGDENWDHWYVEENEV